MVHELILVRKGEGVILNQKEEYSRTLMPCLWVDDGRGPSKPQQVPPRALLSEVAVGKEAPRRPYQAPLQDPRPSKRQRVDPKDPLVDPNTIREGRGGADDEGPQGPQQEGEGGGDGVKEGWVQDPNTISEGRGGADDNGPQGPQQVEEGEGDGEKEGHTHDHDQDEELREKTSNTDNYEEEGEEKEKVEETEDKEQGQVPDPHQVEDKRKVEDEDGERGEA